MPIIYDLTCSSCGHADSDVYIWKKDKAGKWPFPPCTVCGGGTVVRPTRIATPSTRRRQIPKGLRDDFVNRSGFAWRNSQERLTHHEEDRRKGRIGNQDEFSQFSPLTPEERKETGIAEPSTTNEVHYIPNKD